MNENKNNKDLVKKTGFSIRTTESFLKILDEVAKSKQMTKTSVIEYLVMLEHDKINTT